MFLIQGEKVLVLKRKYRPSSDGAAGFSIPSSALLPLSGADSAPKLARLPNAQQPHEKTDDSTSSGSASAPIQSPRQPKAPAPERPSQPQQSQPETLPVPEEHLQQQQQQVRDNEPIDPQPQLRAKSEPPITERSEPPPQSANTQPAESLDECSQRRGGPDSRKGSVVETRRDRDRESTDGGGMSKARSEDRLERRQPRADHSQALRAEDSTSASGSYLSLSSAVSIPFTFIQICLDRSRF